MKNNNVVSLEQSEESSADALTKLLRNGTKKLIAQAVNAELQGLLSQYSHLQVDGRQEIIRNDYLP